MSDMSANNNNNKKRKILNNNNINDFPFTTQLLDFWLVRICERKGLGALFVKSILPFINVFEYYHCEKTLSGPNNNSDRHTDTVRSVSVFQHTSNNRIKFVSCSYDETIKIWDYETGNYCDKTLSGPDTADRHTVYLS